MCQDEEPVWPTTNLHAFEGIVSNYFRNGVRRCILMNGGSYAKVYLFTLENDFQAIGRVVFPVRETVKTEAEVAAMELVRSRTNIPVPQVYLYCSSANNPVGAEWVLMEYLPGECLGDCFERLTHLKKLRTSTDLASVMSSLFSITASHIGSLYNRIAKATLTSTTTASDFCLGPVNDITFLDYPNQIMPELCGPFNSEIEFLEAFAFRGRPATRPKVMLGHRAFEKVIEVFSIIRPFYRGFTFSTSDRPDEIFHLSHGDLSDWNILIDPTTGAVTGIVDWEMAGFRPAWLAAVAPGWLNDDQDRFLMSDHQDRRLEYEDDTIGDAELRSHFRLQLARRNMELFCHYWLGPELRAFFNACTRTHAGNAEIWLRKYEQHEWDAKRRGAFPFDFMAWVWERLALEKTLHANQELQISLKAEPIT